MITIKDIEKIESERRKIRKAMYTKIYEQFNNKIRCAVEMNKRQVFLRVPPFLLGYPRYDVKAAGDYLERQLRNGGFRVSRVGYDELFVSWKPNKSKKPTATDDEDFDLPSLMNLKKVANKLLK
jgi:hypothetical protein